MVTIRFLLVLLAMTACTRARPSAAGQDSNPIPTDQQNDPDQEEYGTGNPSPTTPVDQEAEALGEIRQDLSAFIEKYPDRVIKAEPAETPESYAKKSAAMTQQEEITTLIAATAVTSDQHFRDTLVSSCQMHGMVAKHWTSSDRHRNNLEFLTLLATVFGVGGALGEVKDWALKRVSEEIYIDRMILETHGIPADQLRETDPATFYKAEANHRKAFRDALATNYESIGIDTPKFVLSASIAALALAAYYSKDQSGPYETMGYAAMGLTAGYLAYQESIDLRSLLEDVRQIQVNPNSKELRAWTSTMLPGLSFRVVEPATDANASRRAVAATWEVVGRSAFIASAGAVVALGGYGVWYHLFAEKSEQGTDVGLGLTAEDDFGKDIISLARKVKTNQDIICAAANKERALDELDLVTADLEGSWVRNIGLYLTNDHRTLLYYQKMSDFYFRILGTDGRWGPAQKFYSDYGHLCLRQRRPALFHRF